MSLLFVIDGYNVTNHPQFRVCSKFSSSRRALLNLIRENKLSGSSKNRVTVVFDGYPDAEDLSAYGYEVVFSREKSADEFIKRLVEGAHNPKNALVVSDDKEVRIICRALGASLLDVAAFLGVFSKAKVKEAPDPKLNYSQQHKVNEELRKLWLK
jgi:predicted RNA-binding protein with PIN domain